MSTSNSPLHHSAVPAPAAAGAGTCGEPSPESSYESASGAPGASVSGTPSRSGMSAATPTDALRSENPRQNPYFACCGCFGSTCCLVIVRFGVASVSGSLINNPSSGRVISMNGGERRVP